jgi:hypothetical protein
VAGSVSVAVVIASGFSGCVGSRFSARGRARRDLVVFAGAGIFGLAASSSGIEVVVVAEAVFVVTACSSSTIGTDSLVDSCLCLLDFIVTKRDTLEGVEEAAEKNRLPQPLNLLL